MKLILISGKAGHGKDTLAGFMREQMEKSGKLVLITHYGDLLKYICRSYFDWDGQKDEHGRHLLQHVGTDIIRKQNPDYWVEYIRGILGMLGDEWDYVLIPDVRFPNEIEGMAAFRPYHIRIIRPGFSMLTEEQQKHPSETALDDYPEHPWRVVMNNGTLQDLDMIARCITRDLMEDNCPEWPMILHAQ